MRYRWESVWKRASARGARYVGWGILLRLNGGLRDLWVNLGPVTLHLGWERYPAVERRPPREERM